MIDEIIADARERMEKSLHSLESAFNKIRTGRAHPGILDSVMVNYYGTETPIQQVANITIEDARTIAVTPWEKNLLGDVEKAIMKSDRIENADHPSGLECGRHHECMVDLVPVQLLTRGAREP